MLTYTGARNLFGDLTNNGSTTNLALGDKLINLASRKILTLVKWPFRNKEYTLNTVASLQAYEIPAYLDKVLSCKVTIGGTSYVAKECNDVDTWYKLNQTSIKSDIPEYFILLNNKLNLYPTPVTDDNTITVAGRLVIKDLSIADYTTGTVTTLAALGTAVTGSGTTWTNAMAGRWIKIDEPTGDGRWYEIAGVASNTSLTLVKPYRGTAISAGAGTYTIGQTTILPEDYQDIPVYEAARMYYAVIQPDPGRAEELKILKEEGMARMLSDWQGASEKVVLNEIDVSELNPNDFILGT